MKTKFKTPNGTKKIMVESQWMQSFAVNGSRVNVWSNNKNPFFTVGIVKPGKDQKFYRFCDKKEVELLMAHV